MNFEGSPEAAPPQTRPRGAREALASLARAGLRRAFALSNRIRVPTPAVLPIAGALVGLYSGLAAGLFSNLIAFVGALCFEAPRFPLRWAHRGELWSSIHQHFADARWHLELLATGIPVVVVALALSRAISPGGEREPVKRRLRVLGLLLLGALSLYFPLRALATLNAAIGAQEGLLGALAAAPLWIRFLMPALGGYWVGHLLKRSPETHGHGVPEVVMAIQNEPETLRSRGGLLKLIASALTIGSGGSAGREGPIVYGGAAFASSVGRTLGFTSRELGVLMAAGAGAGIAASFNVPLAGAVFAFEIILREFELSVLAPIILASVTATVVNHGIVGEAFRLARTEFHFLSAWELLLYSALGFASAVVAYAFIQLLHLIEAFFGGGHPLRLSKWLGERSLAQRAALGGLAVGAMSILNPVVWGTGHEVLNLANTGRLSFGFLLLACVLKVLGTSMTIGSGGSGGTFFPSLVMGGMAGGAFGTMVHALWPGVTAGPGAYALVGMGATVAGFTRGPLTGLMIVYELTGSGAILLPLMVATTIASALCHWLVERGRPRAVTDSDVLRSTPVRAVASVVTPVPARIHLQPLLDAVLKSAQGSVPVLDKDGKLYGVVQMTDIGSVWHDESLVTVLNAFDVAIPVEPISAEANLETAMTRMDRSDVDALPVSGLREPGGVGLITRAAIRRYLLLSRGTAHGPEAVPVAATEVATDSHS